MSSRNLLFGVCSAGAMVVVGLLLAGIVERTGGFWYSLDDPYIHLRLSELIREGGYGINRGEYAAPSSSILFPLLLVPAAHTSLHLFIPLLLDVIATGLSLWFLAALMTPSSANFSGMALRAILVFACCLALNMFGVIFTGLEHSLHIAVSLGIVFGLVKTYSDARAPNWLILLIILCPLLRFEGMALSGTALLVLFYDGYRSKAAVAAVLLGCALGIWALFMHMHGLPVMPSSVLVKASTAAAATDNLLGEAGTNSAVGRLGIIFGTFVDHYKYALSIPQGRGVIRLALMTIGALTAAAWQENLRIRAIALRLLVVVVASTAAHLSAGTYDGFSRYELYIKFVCLGATVWALFGEPDLCGRLISELKANSLRRRFAVGAILALLFGGFIVVVDDAHASHEIDATLLTPIGAHNIYAQQAQMARFAHEYAHVPVAINDLGLVSYQSTEYILDLFGLGSEKARRARIQTPPDEWGASGGWMERLAQQYSVKLVMIYRTPRWFPSVPQSWCELGALELLEQDVTPAESKVFFYGTDAAAADKLRKDLTLFFPTLPPEARFVPRKHSTPDDCALPGR